jgi:two-component system response regulator MprA
MARILIVEDDPLLAASLVRALGYEGHEIASAHDGLTALDLARHGSPDLVLLDLMLPGMDGIEVCRRIRALSDLPILMLTARDGVADRVHGLDSGADDYLVKPFAHEELMARIRTLLRRQQVHQPAELACADLLIELDAHVVKRAGRVVDLTAQEFRLLEYLVRNRDRVLSRAQLLSAVWDLEADTTSNVVDVYVRYLRQKLEAEDEIKLIHTVRGVGYILRSPDEAIGS